MPIYEYKCQQCGAHFEKRQNVSDEPLTTCEKCHGKLEKQWSLSGFQFKGAGWYVTDYAGKKADTSTGSAEKTSSTESTANAEPASNSKSDSSATKRTQPKLRQVVFAALAASIYLGLLSACALAQSRHNSQGIDPDGAIFSVTASRTDGKKDPITIDSLALYENGVEQKIKNFAYDPSPSKIVILVDNSQTLPASVENLRKAVMEFAYEIFDGDQLFVLAYDEKPEIVQEWTDDAKKMEKSLSTFGKKGNPYLFDGLDAAMKDVLLPLMPGTRKTAIVVIGDGLDRGSTTAYDKVLGELQNDNITVYALQIPDRTGGAYRRDHPKAADVLKQLTEGTGGQIFAFDDPTTAAKSICDELRRNRYLISYVPRETSTFDAKSIFLVANDGISVRNKKAQPPNVK